MSASAGLLLLIIFKLLKLNWWERFLIYAPHALHFIKLTLILLVGHHYPALLQGQFTDPCSAMALPRDTENLQNLISISTWITYFFMSYSFLFVSIYELLKLSISTLLVFTPLTSVLEENKGKTGETQTLHIILNLAERNEAKRTFWKMTAFPQSCLLYLRLQKPFSLKK